MSIPFDSTHVTFPSGATTGSATIRTVHELPDGVGVITDTTCFHPLDHTWPDQPADTGTMTVADQTWPVLDCLTGASQHGTGDLLIGASIPARRGDADWAWHVVHVVDVPIEQAVSLVGSPATLRVDADRRAQLSAAHTACHLMALALNQAVAGRWRKDTTRDSLGHPDFDAVAISSSRIAETGSIDVYRLGKSLRKKGFTTAATPDAPSLAEALDDIVADMSTTLNGWLASGAPVRVTADDPQLTAVRHWTCELPEGTARLRCGGTHLRSLGELAGISVEATLNDTGDELTVITTPHRAAAS